MKRELLPLETEQDRINRDNIIVTVINDDKSTRDVRLGELFNREGDTWFSDLIFWTKEYIKDAWFWIRYTLPHYLRNIYHWNKMIYNTRYWSSHYALMHELNWCRHALKYWTVNDIYVDQWITRRTLRWMISLLEILVHDKDDENPDQVMVNISNASRFMESRFWKDKLAKDGPTSVFKRELRYRKVWSLYHKVRMYKFDRI